MRAVSEGVDDDRAADPESSADLMVGWYRRQLEEIARADRRTPGDVLVDFAKATLEEADAS